MSEQAQFKYVNAGAVQSVAVKVANPSEGFALIKRDATEAQAEAGFTGKRLLIHSDKGTIGLDIWQSNSEQVKQAVATLASGEPVTLSCQDQHRINEETGLKDATDGIPNVYKQWSLPRVGQSAEAVLAEL